MERVRDVLCPVLGPGVRLDVEVVAEIAPGPGGKYLLAYSLVGGGAAGVEGERGSE